MTKMHFESKGFLVRLIFRKKVKKFLSTLKTFYFKRKHLYHIFGLENGKSVWEFDKEGRKLVRKGLFGVGKWKKDWISKLRTFLTKAIIQYTFKMHLKAIQKSNNKAI